MKYDKAISSLIPTLISVFMRFSACRMIPDVAGMETEFSQRDLDGALN